MKITKSQKRLFIILFIVIIYAIYDFIKNREQYDILYIGKSNKSEIILNQTSNLVNKSKMSEVKKIDLNWKRDPFLRPDKEPRKKARKPPQKVNLKLNAITYAAGNSLVIINDIILKEGEVIEGYVVDKIYQNQVKLSKGGKSIYLNSK